MSNYIPRLATIAETCEWLAAETGEQWTLPRLLEAALQPWVWLDYSPEQPAIFGGRYEGFLAPFVFMSDTFRLEADRQSALMTMTRTPDGNLLKITPGLRIALAELRFKREDVTQLAAALRAPAPVAPTLMRECDEQQNSNAAPPNDDWREQARAIANELDAADRKAGAHDSLKGVAERVAEHMRKRGIIGPRGPVSGSTVLREALQGGKWKRKQ